MSSGQVDRSNIRRFLPPTERYRFPGLVEAEVVGVSHLGSQTFGHGKEHMKIVVIGGTGLIGSKLVKKLRVHGQEVVAASPASGVNSVTGEGLADALKRASVV